MHCQLHLQALPRADLQGAAGQRSLRAVHAGGGDSLGGRHLPQRVQRVQDGPEAGSGSDRPLRAARRPASERIFKVLTAAGSAVSADPHLQHLSLIVLQALAHETHVDARRRGQSEKNWDTNVVRDVLSTHWRLAHMIENRSCTVLDSPGFFTVDRDGVTMGGDADYEQSVSSRAIAASLGMHTNESGGNGQSVEWSRVDTSHERMGRNPQVTDMSGIEGVYAEVSVLLDKWCHKKQQGADVNHISGSSYHRRLHRLLWTKLSEVSVPAFIGDPASLSKPSASFQTS